MLIPGSRSHAISSVIPFIYAHCLPNCLLHSPEKPSCASTLTSRRFPSQRRQIERPGKDSMGPPGLLRKCVVLDIMNAPSISPLASRNSLSPICQRTSTMRCWSRMAAGSPENTNCETNPPNDFFVEFVFIRFHSWPHSCLQPLSLKCRNAKRTRDRVNRALSEVYHEKRRAKLFSPWCGS